MTEKTTFAEPEKNPGNTNNIHAESEKVVFTFYEYCYSDKNKDYPKIKECKCETTPEMLRQISNLNDSFRMSERRHNRCCCDDKNRHLCNQDCCRCRFHTFSELPLSNFGKENMNIDECLSEQSNASGSYSMSVDTNIAICMFLEKLDKESANIIRLVFEGSSDREAAEMLGIAKSTYNRKKQKIIQKFADELRSILTN